MKQSSSSGDVVSKKHFVIILIILIIAVAGYIIPRYLLSGNRQAATEPMKMPDQQTVQSTADFGDIPVQQFGLLMKDDQQEADVKSIATRLNGQMTGQISELNFYQLEIPSATAENYRSLFDKLRNTKGVELVIPNSLIVTDKFDESKGTCDPLDDPVYQDSSYGRNFSMIGLKNAYAFIKASGLTLHNVKVGVADTYIYAPTDELGGNNTVSTTTTDKDDYNDNPQKNKNGQIIHDGQTHGTMVNEVISANADNGGITGVASVLGNKLQVQTTNIFKQNKYVVSVPDPGDPTQVTEAGVTYTHTTLKAIYDQIKNGATVINCSFGPKKYDEDHSFETQLYEKFYQKIQEKYPKVVIVGSAGNSNAELDGTNGQNKGQKTGNLLTVGALNPDGNKSAYSNYGSANAEVSISAPADNFMYGMDQNGNPIRASGTSFAAPQVAGTVALIQSINPDLTAQEIKTIIQSSADGEITDRSGNKHPVPANMGTGMLRVDKAVLKVINDMRAKKGLPPLSEQSLLDMNRLDLSYTGGPEEFVVRAKIAAINGSKTILNLDISGNNYSFGGGNTKTLTAPGEASWNLSLQKDGKVTVKVSRSDTKSCAWVVIEAVELTGTWDLTGTVTYAKLDASLGTMKDMGKTIYGADEKEMDAGQREAEKSMIGQVTPLGSLDVEQWKYMGFKIRKEGSSYVLTTPYSDDPNAMSSIMYYIDQINGNEFTGRAIAKNNLGGRMNEIHYDLKGVKKQ